MSIDWSKAPFDAEAGTAKSDHYFAAWYRRDGNGQVQQICHEAGFKEWTWMGGRKDFPVGSELRPKAVVPWSGEGLPPVGTVCSACVKNGPTWLEITVLAVTGQHLIAREGAGDEFSVRHIFWEFRPIRTAEQIAAEERAATIKTILADAGVTDSAWNDDPEAEVWAAALYDAGYRKQVQP